MKHRAPVIIIAAVGENGVIGSTKTNSLPWDPPIPGELARFKNITIGKGNNGVIMGRKTAESLPRCPLPGRKNVVITKNRDWKAPDGVKAFSTLEAAINELDGNCDEIYIIGGAEVYKEALKFADEMLLTRVHQNPEGDVFFPEYDPEEWQLVNTEFFTEHGYEVLHFMRKNTSAK